MNKIFLIMYYMQPFEDDLKALFDKIKELRAPIHEIDEARKKLRLKIIS
jgi:hypothetical protein